MFIGTLVTGMMIEGTLMMSFDRLELRICLIACFHVRDFWVLRF